MKKVNKKKGKKNKQDNLCRSEEGINKKIIRKIAVDCTDIGKQIRIKK